MAQFLQVLQRINWVAAVLFFFCYSYQFFYIVVSIFKKRKVTGPGEPHRFGIIVSARNEEAVIGTLLRSIAGQTYPSDMITVFVVADNCTDSTAEVARREGAVVFERNDLSNIGKGYALEFLMERINENYPRDAFDAFIVFDADNVLEPNYVEEINKTYSAGYRIITSYRNSKNYGDNWISAGYGLMFLREARHLNGARMALGTSCSVSGTGFLFDRAIIENEDGKLEWKWFLLTEDAEFSTVNIIKGERIGYCSTAHFYDEQPTKFIQSWKQRIRWAKGYWQVLRHYGVSLLKGMFKGRSGQNFACYDMTMSIMPAMILSIFVIIIDLIGMICTLATPLDLPNTVSHTAWLIFKPLFDATSVMFLIGLITTITEWKNIHTTAFKKILYSVTFPLYTLTYIPIAISSFFKKVTWTHIDHSRDKSIEEIKRKK